MNDNEDEEQESLSRSDSTTAAVESEITILEENTPPGWWSVMKNVWTDSWKIIRFIQSQSLFKEERSMLNSLLILRVLSLISSIVSMVMVSYPLAWMVNALSIRDSDNFRETWQMFVALVMISAPIVALDEYLTAVLWMYFDKVVTKILLQRFYSFQGFYHLNRDRDIVDNPGIRLAEDIDAWSWGSLQLSQLLMKNLAKIVGWTMVLINIDPIMLTFSFIIAFGLVIFAVLLFGSTLTHFTRLIKRDMAEYKSGLIRTTDNAENIALYHADRFELRWSYFRFLKMLNHWSHFYLTDSLLQFFEYLVMNGSRVLPVILLAPPIFRYDLNMGDVFQALIAFQSLMRALTIIVSRLERFCEVEASGQRLAQLIDHLILHEHDCVDDPRGDHHHHHHHQESKENNEGIIHFEFIDDDSMMIPLPNHQNENQPQLMMKRCLLSSHNLSFSVPESCHFLMRNVNLNITEHRNVLVTGESGVGKSSLLRVLYSLWKWGEGSVSRIHNRHSMFLPQKPYLPQLPAGMNTLFKQLTFPDHQIDKRDLSKIKIRKILEQCNLSYIMDRKSREWSTMLSLGEQQRLAFARILVQKPRLVFLDEATSALDIANERRMYELLRSEGITFISVGHRNSLLSFHELLFQVINADQHQVFDIQGLKPAQIQALLQKQHS